MKRLSIRLRLTAWYFIVLSTTFLVFGIVALFAMRRGIETTVDEGLHDRLSGIRELMASASPKGPEGLEQDLREHSEVRAGGDLSQVSDSEGHWLFRSQLMRRFDIPRREAASDTYYDAQSQGLPLRVLAGEIRLGGQTYLVQVATPMDDFDDAMDRFKAFLLWFSPLLLVLACAGGYWMSSRALRPVDEITRAAHNIDPKNLAIRLAVPQSGDELQRLSETLNGMLERIHAAFKRITQFTADASHELRTPVALVRTTAELSLRKSRSESEYRDSLTRILRESEKITALIENLMMLARTDSGYETLRFVPVNLTSSLAEACREGRILAEAKGVGFREQLPGGAIVVAGDPDALHRLFLILLDNAVKYTPPGGEITVSLAVRRADAVVEVRDTGIGIGTEDLPRIFERFYRADKARSPESGGAGLGLSIARWVAEAHGGSILVQSQLGAGSVFYVRLPLEKG